MKKIVFIHHSGEIGGAGVSLFNTVLLLSHKFEIVVYCPSKPEFYYNYLKNEKINVKTYSHDLGSIPYYSGGANVFSLSFIKSIINIKLYKKNWEKILKSENPDLLIVNSRILVWFSIITNKLKIKSICYIRETRKITIFNFINNIQKHFLKKFSAVVFISNYDKTVENLEFVKTAVIPNFIDEDAYLNNNYSNEIYYKYNIKKSSFNILFVGGMLKIKGYNYAVKALKYLKGYNINLIVAGDSEFKYRENKGVVNRIYNFMKRRYETKIINEIEKNNLTNIIKIGTQHDMRPIYELCDVLIFPATEPHQARPAFEAGMKKKPVIMPDFKNTNEYIKHGINGLIFKHHNSKDLADKILLLINNKQLKIKLGENNFQFTIKNHTKEKSEKLLLNIVNEVIKN